MIGLRGFVLAVVAVAPVLFGRCADAADASADWRPTVRWRGFNLLSHFGRGGRGFPPEFPEADFVFLETNGFNFARLPLDYRFWTKDGRWDEIDDARLGAIDRAIACGRKHGVHVQLAFHRAPGYTVTKPRETKDLLSDPEALAVCAKHWAHLARRYRGIPNEDLSFNLFNEPPQTPGTNYARVARALIRAIRAEDPSRFIISDGIDWGSRPCREIVGLRGVGQAARGYQPMRVTHYRCRWLDANTPWDWPVWPMRVHDPVGVLASHFGNEPLVIADPPAGATARIRFGTVNGKVTVGASADGRPIGELTLDPSAAGALWTNRTYVAEWKSWRGRYEGTLDVRIPDGAKEFGVSLIAGDWAQVCAVEFLSGGCSAALAVTPRWQEPSDFGQRFLGWTRGFASQVTHPKPRYADPGMEWLYVNSLRPWDELAKTGTFVMVGEAGFAGNLRLAEDNLQLWKERNWGWALWDLGYVRDPKTGKVTDPALMDLIRRY